MAGTATPAPFVWGSGGRKMTPEQIERERKIAERLLSGAGDTSPVAHPLQGVARVAQALAGVVKERRAAGAESAANERGMAAMRAAFGGGSSPAADMPAAGASPSSLPSDMGAPAASSAAPAGGDFSTIGARLSTDLMRDFGLSREQAAGFVGNLAHESGGFKTLQEIEPMIPGSRGGFGYAQWTGPRRRAFESWAQENGLDPTSYEANYGFLAHELKNTPEGRVLESLRTASDPATAARIVSDRFLRPGIPHMDSRLSYAQQAMQLPLADMPAPGASPSQTPPGNGEGFVIPGGGQPADPEAAMMAAAQAQGEFPPMGNYELFQPGSMAPGAVSRMMPPNVLSPEMGIGGIQATNTAAADALAPPIAPGLMQRSRSLASPSPAPAPAPVPAPAPSADMPAPGASPVQSVARALSPAQYGEGGEETALSFFRRDAEARGQVAPPQGGGNLLSGIVGALTSAGGAPSPVAGVAGALAQGQPGGGRMDAIMTMLDPTMPAATQRIGAALLQQELAQQQAANQPREMDIREVNGRIVGVDRITGESRDLTPEGLPATDPASGARMGLTPIYGEDAEGNPVLLQMSNQGGVATAPLPEGIQIRRDPIRIDAGTHVVLLDPITRQPISSIPKDNEGAAADSARGTALGRADGEATAGASRAVVQSDTILSDIDAVLDDPGLDNTVGWGSYVPFNIPNFNAETRSRLDKLQGQAFLQAFESLKGGGQITQVEGQKAEQAIARLGRAQSPDEFREALREFREVVAAARERSAQRLPQQQPPAAADPSAMSDEDLFSILRGQ